MIDELILAVDALIEQGADVGLLLVGDLGYEIPSAVRKVLEDRRDAIVITGYADDADYRDYLKSADIAVQLRRTTRGETSRAVLDCFAYGLPVVLNRLGPFLDIEEDAVCWLPERPSVKDITGVLGELLGQPAKRAKIGGAGRSHLQDAHGAAAVRDAFSKARALFSADCKRRDPVLAATRLVKILEDAGAVYDPVALSANLCKFLMLHKLPDRADRLRVRLLQPHDGEAPPGIRKLLRHLSIKVVDLEALVALPDPAFIHELYGQLLSRPPDAEGHACIDTALRQGHGTRMEVINSLMASPEFIARPELVVLR